MLLITKEIKKKMPAIGEQAKSKNITFYCKLFTPWTRWTWYIAEADWETGECFGYVQGFESELGYFDLNELMEIRGPFGLKIERDRFFTTKTLSQLKK
jgi:hypothetical protein